MFDTVPLVRTPPGFNRNFVYL